MKHLLLALALLTAPGAALACSCAAPETEQEKRDYARFIAARIDAIVEAEPLSGPDMKRQTGDTYRIVKVLAGNASTGPIRMARSFGRDPRTGEARMGGTSCDVFPASPKTVLLMRTGYQPEGGGTIVPAYTMPGTPCGQQLPVRDAPAAIVSRGHVPVFNFGMSCTDWFLGQPGAVALISAEARKLGRPGF